MTPQLNLRKQQHQSQLQHRQNLPQPTSGNCPLAPLPLVRQSTTNHGASTKEDILRQIYSTLEEVFVSANVLTQDEINFVRETYGLDTGKITAAIERFILPAFDKGVLGEYLKREFEAARAAAEMLDDSQLEALCTSHSVHLDAMKKALDGAKKGLLQNEILFKRVGALLHKACQVIRY